jgi:hypothetical protein
MKIPTTTSKYWTSILSSGVLMVKTREDTRKAQPP